jgi:tRNA threonylcarbamoyl adenosine modification protein YjeE
MREPASWLLARMRPGDWALLEGGLGAGKTTLCREILRLAGWEGPVRSPTFNLVQYFPTDPPIVHVDLYRVPSEHGLGLEDLTEDAVVLVEWPDRLRYLHLGARLWNVQVEFLPHGRKVTVQGPLAESPNPASATGFSDPS